MDFDLKEIESLSGAKAHVYSVVFPGNSKSLLEQFFDDNKAYTSDLKKVRNKILVMSQSTGCRRSFFKEGEGAWADGVVAIRNTGQLRLYGIYFHDAVILFGSGGYKPPGIAAYQDYQPLNEKAQQMKAIAKEIYNMIKNGDLVINEDGTIEVF